MATEGPTIGQAVAAALLLTVLLPDLNEASEIRVRAAEQSPTVHAVHDQSDTTRGPHLEYANPGQNFAMALEGITMKSSTGILTPVITRAVPEQLELF
jgi:hypothetical protein